MAASVIGAVDSAVVEIEQQHGVDDARDGGGDDRSDDPHAAQGAADQRADADGDEEREGGGAERPLARMSRARPPTKAQVRPTSTPPAMAAMTPNDEDQVRDGIADLQVRGDRELSERGDHGERRGNDESHVADRSPADEPTVGANVDGPRRRRDSSSSIAKYPTRPLAGAIVRSAYGGVDGDGPGQPLFHVKHAVRAGKRRGERRDRHADHPAERPGTGVRC